MKNVKESAKVRTFIKQIDEVVSYHFYSSEGISNFNTLMQQSSLEWEFPK